MILEAKQTEKYEVVVGVPDDLFVNGKYEDNLEKVIDKWQEFAKLYYEDTDIYVSAIAISGKAVYNADWGCPPHGERVFAFHCTANREFIKSENDLRLYEKGVLYIAKKLKKEFNQSTITITKLSSLGCKVYYMTNENVKSEVEYE